jgi:hypothetical protein
MYFFKDRPSFMLELFNDLRLALKQSKSRGLKPVVRLNVTSDIPWESMLFEFETKQTLIDLYPEVQFYDYTKSIQRIRRHATKPIRNLSLTFSRSEVNIAHCLEALRLGYNVAVVFRTALPNTYLGHPVINGDEHDFRFLDRGPCIVGLLAKGKAKKDASGFVVG